MLVHLVADFGVADLAFAEVTQRLKDVLPEAEVHALGVPRFATLAAGFAVAQLALNRAPEGTVVFQNVAPRRDDGSARRRNEGEPLVAGRTSTGVTVVGVNAGHAFSFLREAGVQLRYVSVDAFGSQFRSRDVFPEGVAAVVRGDPEAVGAEVEASAVPRVPDDAVAYVDGFGNLKLTVRAPMALPDDALVSVRIGDHEQEARLADGSFAVPAGQLALAAGSSGWPLPGKGPVRFMELFLRGGSAAAAFGEPPVGAAVRVRLRTATI